MEEVYTSEIMTIPDNIKLELLTSEEREVFEKLTDEEKKEVFNQLDIETVIGISINFGCPVSTMRLMVMSFEKAVPLMPEEARESIERLKLFFLDCMHTAMEEAKSGVCPDCGQPHEMDEDGKRKLN